MDKYLYLPPPCIQLLDEISCGSQKGMIGFSSTLSSQKPWLKLLRPTCIFSTQGPFYVVFGQNVNPWKGTRFANHQSYEDAFVANSNSFLWESKELQNCHFMSLWVTMVHAHFLSLLHALHSLYLTHSHAPFVLCFCWPKRPLWGNHGQPPGGHGSKRSRDDRGSFSNPTTWNTVLKDYP